jgi:hypothetical protein
VAPAAAYAPLSSCSDVTDTKPGRSCRTWPWFTSRRLVAVFRDPDPAAARKRWIRRAVLGFDSKTGVPMVLGDGDRRARRADYYHNFEFLEFDEAPVVAALPGQGWRVEFTDDNGESRSQPIVGWLVRADGSVTPADTNEAGCVMELDTGTGGKWRIYHRTSTTPPHSHRPPLASGE